MFRAALFVLLIGLSVVALGGCASTITAIFDRPVLEHHIETKDPISVVALKADRRLVIFSSQEQDGGTTRYYIVSEPSPDAYAELTSLLQFAAKAKGSGDQAGVGKIDVEGRLKLVDKISTRLARLGVRSQGLSFFRDGSFRLAEAYLNGMLDEAEYKGLINTLIIESSHLIEFELEKNPGLAAIYPTDDPHWDKAVLKIKEIKKILDSEEDQQSTDEADTDQSPTTESDPGQP